MYSILLFGCLQEAELFKAWVEAEEAKVAAAEAAAAVVEQEEEDVGPTLPGQALANKARANIGGFLLPGEGDRSVGVNRTQSSGQHGGKGGRGPQERAQSIALQSQSEIVHWQG
jgi:hypothetical protein